MEENEEERENKTDQRDSKLRKSIQKIKEIANVRKKSAETYDENNTNEQGYTNEGDNDQESVPKYPPTPTNLSSDDDKLKTPPKLHETRNKCGPKKRWTCGEDALWRIYMKS